jgi:acetoin:2,6-dichlorophenolindophenol oxidoreductase subunit alpha
MTVRDYSVIPHRASSLLLYRSMLRIRLFEKSLAKPIQHGQIKAPCYLYIGQEAIAVGLCAALKKTDLVFGSHRSHGLFLAKGGGIKELMAEIYCKRTGCSKGRGGSMHIADPGVGMMGSVPIVAGGISLALGAALASSIRKDDRVTVSFFGDGATGEGALYESLNFAALKKLKMIFVCENNYYSTHLPIREFRLSYDIHDLATSFGVINQQVNGNDVLEVLRVGKEAVAACRGGRGPVFLEFTTYRQGADMGPDDHIHGGHKDGRPKDEIASWKAMDPIKRFEEHLLENKIAGMAQLKLIESELLEELEEAERFAVDSLFPTKEELMDDVFCK